MRKAKEPIIIETPNTIQVPFLDFEVDWQAAKEAIKPFPGIVYVEMAPRREDLRGFLLPDKSQRALRADVAVVLAVGKDRRGPILTGSGHWEKPLPLEVVPGLRVLVDPYRGDQFEGFSVGGYVPKGVVRVYGDASCDEWRERARQVDECIMAIVEESPVKVVDVVAGTPKAVRSLRPAGRFVLIKRIPLTQRTDNGLYVPDREQKRSPIGTIVAVSARAAENGFETGMRVQYRPMCVHPLKMYELDLADDILDLDGPIEDYALIPYANISAVL